MKKNFAVIAAMTSTMLASCSIYDNATVDGRVAMIDAAPVPTTVNGSVGDMPISIGGNSIAATVMEPNSVGNQTSSRLLSIYLGSADAIRAQSCPRPITGYEKPMLVMTVAIPKTAVAPASYSFVRSEGNPSNAYFVSAVSGAMLDFVNDGQVELTGFDTYGQVAGTFLVSFDDGQLSGSFSIPVYCDDASPAGD